MTRATGEPLSADEVDYDADRDRGGFGRLLEVRRPTLFDTPFASDQMCLFVLSETLGQDGWLKAVRLDDYAPKGPCRRGRLKHDLLAYTDAT